MIANDIIKKAFQLAKLSNLPEHVLTDIRFALMVRLVRFVFKYGVNQDCPEVEKDFCDPVACGAQFAADLIQLCPQACITNPWQGGADGRRVVDGPEG